jgi:hypothetical protein
MSSAAALLFIARSSSFIRDGRVTLAGVARMTDDALFKAFKPDDFVRLSVLRHFYSSIKKSSTYVSIDAYDACYVPKNKKRRSGLP